MVKNSKDNETNIEYVTVNGVNLRYKFEGTNNKITLVFIHGLSDSLEFWLPITSEFKKEYKILSYDLRGHGGSECGDNDGNINTHQEDLYLLLKTLNIKNPVFIGLSMGGNIALKIAVQHPEITKGLILLSTYAESDQYLTDTFKLIEENMNKGFESFYEFMIEKCLPQNIIEMHKDSLELIKKEKAKTTNIVGIQNGITACSNFSVLNELEKIVTPSLILAGEDDEITTVKTQEIIYNNIKNSEFYIFPKTKHNLLIGNNIREINHLIREFLNNTVKKNKSKLNE